MVGERQVSGSPGTFVFIPRGTVHAAKVIGTEPGKVLAAYRGSGQPGPVGFGVVAKLLNYGAAFAYLSFKAF